MLPIPTKNLTLTPKTKEFLDSFPGTLYAYIADHNEKLPVIHSEDLQLERQQEGFGIFFTVNGFHGGKRTNETLTNLNGFFCDIDYPDKINKTPDLIHNYKQDLLAELYEGGCLPTYIVETKNGLHVYWLFKMPIYLKDLNPEQQDRLKVLYRDIEEAILRRFDGDPGAKDVARVLRVPGTMHQKDPNDMFEVKLIHSTGEERFTFSELQNIFLKKEAPDTWATVNGENPISEEVKKDIEVLYPKLKRPSYEKLLSKVPGSIPEGMRNKALLVAAYACKEAGWTMEDTFKHFNEFHGLHMREIRKTIRSAFEHSYDFGYNNEVMQALVTQDERTELSKVTSKVLSKSTKEKRTNGNEEQKQKYLTYEFIVAERHPYLKYKARGDFYNYDGGVYKPMQQDDVRSIIFNEMLKDGLTNYRKLSAVNDKIACFKSLDGRTFTHEDENQNQNIINLQNGLLDIGTYQLVAHTPEYLSTSQIPVSYDAHAKCPTWIYFVNDIMDGDKEQVRLLQQIAGYSLTTSMALAKAFIFFGSGANGKSLFTKILSKVVGQQNVSTVNLSSINKQFGLTGIVGKKLNLIDEISGNYFESNIIKALISGEKLSADVKYRPEPIEFIPTSKLIFSVNELPKINDTTPGLYRRFLIIPFNRSYLEKPDVFLEQKLSLELPGILNWAIEGLRDLRQEGRFNETKTNHDMMGIFKNDNSPLTEFLSANYEPAPIGEEAKYAVQSSDLYREYKAYCFEMGYKSKSLANFSRELIHNTMSGWKFGKVKVSNTTYFTGLRRISTITGDKIVYREAVGVVSNYPQI